MSDTNQSPVDRPAMQVGNEETPGAASPSAVDVQAAQVEESAVAPVTTGEEGEEPAAVAIDGDNDEEGVDSDGDEDEDDDEGADDDNQDGDNNDEDGTANVPNTDHFVWIADRADAVEETTACKVCLTDPDPVDVVYVECGHIWCRDCLNQYFGQVFSDREQFPPRCCIQEGFNLDNIQVHLSDEILLHVMKKWEEWSSEDPTYCSNIQCNAFVPVDRVIGQWAICATCRVKTCVECKAKDARHTSPDQHPEPVKDLNNEKLAEKEGWKFCPNRKCNKLVEKIEGCDTMTCLCGQQFCYRCGNSFEDPYPCTCGGQNDWVPQMQAWANGANGDNGDHDSNEDEEENDEEDKDSDSDNNDDDDIDEDVDHEAGE